MGIFTKSNQTVGSTPLTATSGEWTYDTDVSGNHWYINHGLQAMVESGRLVVGGSGVDRINFDMRIDTDREVAANLCAPLSRVLNKCGLMASNGRLFITDEENNEQSRYLELDKLLRNPNPIQNTAQFFEQIERTIMLHGWVPIYAPRAFRSALPSALFILNPVQFKITWSGERFPLTKEDLFAKSYLDVNGTRLDIDSEDYFIISNTDAILPEYAGREIKFSSTVSSLTHSVNNWTAQIVARGQLIKHGGPKGILYSPDDKTGTGNSVMTGAERKVLQDWFKRRFGLANKQQEVVAVTNKNIAWIPLTFKSAELMLHEENVACQNEIAANFGLNNNVFSSDSTYENQRDAKKSAYEDLIIPSVNFICEKLTENLINDGGKIYLDYSHLPCMQEDYSLRSQSVQQISQAIKTLIEVGAITALEARMELSKYIDIDPDSPNGEIGNNVA